MIIDELITQSTFDAAKSGNVDANILIGESYLYGKNGLTRDRGTACKYLQKARANGSGEACLVFVQMHEQGIHHEVDLKAALEWAIEAQRLGANGADEVIARITHRLEEPSQSRSSVTKNAPISHAAMAKRIRKGGYSTFRSGYGEYDNRPFIFAGKVLPVRYVQYVPTDGGGRRTYAVWPEGDIKGYLENAQVGDMLFFPAWRDIQRWEHDDIIFDYTAEGWVPHVDSGYR